MADLFSLFDGRLGVCLAALLLITTACADEDAGGDAASPSNNTVNNDDDIFLDDPSLPVCQRACNKIFACLVDICPADVARDVNDVEACVSTCELDPAFNPDATLARSCNNLNEAVCVANPDLGQLCACPGLDVAVTNAGAACQSDDQCTSEGLTPDCVPATDPNTGEETGFRDGYCVVAGCLNDAACGPGKFCVPLQTGATPEQTTNFCLGGCTPTDGRSICRAGYGCWSITEDLADGVCFPECLSNSDCDDGEFCDFVNTGACAANE